MHQKQMESISFPYTYTMYKDGLWKGCFLGDAMALLEKGWFDKTIYKPGDESHVLKRKDESVLREEDQRKNEREEPRQQIVDTGGPGVLRAEVSEENELDRRLGSESRRRGRPRKAGHPS